MQTIHVVPIPLVKVKGKCYWGVPSIWDGPKSSKVERRIKKQLNAGENAVIAFNTAYLSDQKILFVIDDIHSEEEFAFNKEDLPFAINPDRIVLPPKELSFNTLSFSETKLLKYGKQDHSIRTSSQCGTAFGQLMKTFPDSILIAHIPLVCVPNIKNALIKQQSEQVFIKITNSKGSF